MTDAAPGGGELTIRVELTEADVFDWFRHRYRSARRWRRRQRGAVLLVLFCGVMPLAINGYAVLAGEPLLFQWIVAATIVAGCAAVAGGLVAWNARRPEFAARAWLRQGRNRDCLTGMTLTVSPEGLGFRTSNAEGRSSWALVADVEEGGGFVCVRMHNGVFFIPERCLAGEAQRRRLIDLIRRYRRTAPPPAYRCARCGYDLSGVEIDGCPECGWRRDAEDG